MGQPTEPDPSRASANRYALAVAAVLVVVGAFAVVGPWVVRSRDTHIDANGARAWGRIEAVSPALSEGGDGEFTITYSFETASGSNTRSSRAVSEAYWRDAVVGQTVDVRYDPDAPANNHPAGFGQTSIGVALFVSGVGLLVGGFGLLVILGAVRRPSTQPSGPDTATD